MNYASWVAPRRLRKEVAVSCEHRVSPASGCSLPTAPVSMDPHVMHMLLEYFLLSFSFAVETRLPVEAHVYTIHRRNINRILFER